MGYVLPWGQMSFWAATVITNLFSAIPVVGGSIVTWLWGGFAVGNPTLNRFYSLHYLLPFVIVGVVVLHIWALHMVGQNNPTGVEPKTDKDTVAFTPYATVKDAFFIGLFCIVLAWFIFYIPNYLGHSDNYIPANPGQTPTHIVPEWYYLPFYAILRGIPSKLLGVTALAASIIVLAFMPWLDTSPRAIGELPAALPAVFVHLLCRRHRARLSRLAGADRRLCDRGANPDDLLFRVLLRHPAALGAVRDNQAAAEFDLRVGVAEGRSDRSVGAAARRARLKGAPAMKRHHRLAIAFALAGLLCDFGAAASAQEADAPPRLHWSFSGPFGIYDQAQLQRGFKIYREVCSTCHSLKLLSFRNLADPGGPGFTEAQAAAIAATFPGDRRAERSGPDVPAAGQDIRLLSRRRSRTSRRPRRARRQAAAGHVRSRQGAKLRVGLSLVHP